jgi:para-aminobenzoate synthetase/4-amino-4-deoxychorismate lyase
LFHKTSDRAPYDEAIPSHPESVDVILWNERGEITESRIANIVVDIDGELVTPPLSCGLLAGCYRRHLLERGEIRERIILKADLPRATRIIFINSLRRSWNVHYLLNAEAESSVSTPSA